MSNNQVSARIRLLRMQRGFTQEEFAGALGVSRSAVALWETNRGGETRHLSRIAKLLAVPVDALLNGMANHDMSVTVTADEWALIRDYRTCRPEGQLALLRAASRLGNHTTGESDRDHTWQGSSID
jgi:transcriptional regulator with XRE-family HTH domain